MPSWRNTPASTRMSNGSAAHRRTDRLAEIQVRPARLSAYAMPGLRTPSRDRIGGVSPQRFAGDAHQDQEHGKASDESELATA